MNKYAGFMKKLEGAVAELSTDLEAKRAALVVAGELAAYEKIERGVGAYLRKNLPGNYADAAIVALAQVKETTAGKLDNSVYKPHGAGKGKKERKPARRAASENGGGKVGLTDFDDSFISLYKAGLSPADIGKLYSKSGSTVNYHLKNAAKEKKVKMRTMKQSHATVPKVGRIAKALGLTKPKAEKLLKKKDIAQEE